MRHVVKVGEAEHQMTSKDGNPIKGQDGDPAMEQNLEFNMGSSSAGAEARLTAESQGQIARQLRRAYEEMLAEPLPAKFTKLLEELAKKEPGP